MISPNSCRVLERRHLGAAVAADRRLDHADQLLGVARLGHPGVGAEPQPADPLGDRRRAGADDHGQAREPRADALEVLPAAGAEDREVDDQRVQPHRHQRVGRGRRRQRAVLPPERVEPVGQHLHESRVAVDDRQPEPLVGRAAVSPGGSRKRLASLRRHGRHSNAQDQRKRMCPEDRVTGSLHAPSGGKVHRKFERCGGTWLGREL